MSGSWQPEMALTHHDDISCDVFISYAREDRVSVERLAERLHAAGWTVWWDSSLRAGEAFADTIAGRIDAASIVLVLWSSHAAASQWVKAEAMAAQQQSKLLPVMVERIPLPVPFNAFHTVDLSTWDGAPDDSRLLALLAELVDRLAGAGRADGKPRQRLDASDWQAVLLGKEATSRRFLATLGTRRHDVRCHFHPNHLWNRFVVTVDGVEAATGGHQFRDEISLPFDLGDDWLGLVLLACGSTAATGELLCRCDVSIGGKVLYREPGSPCPQCGGSGQWVIALPLLAPKRVRCLNCGGTGRVYP
ncbi:MAG: TIR domain-containing protein [Zoogloeaceae bacterium]|nr:TIR domain-containing protein [Rhodocyclaceae bacterium]MCP5234345.1 TIR domain-containing protein [Zoogloeaceae bacterium]